MSQPAPLTAEQYQNLGPWQQGWASYMQGAWNKNIPDANPYKVSTPPHEEWKAGNQMAMLDVQDGEE